MQSWLRSRACQDGMALCKEPNCLLKAPCLHRGQRGATNAGLGNSDTLSWIFHTHPSSCRLLSTCSLTHSTRCQSAAGPAGLPVPPHAWVPLGVLLRLKLGPHLYYFLNPYIRSEMGSDFLCVYSLVLRQGNLIFCQI